MVLHGRLSVRHTKADRAEALRRGINRAYAHLQDSRPYRELQEKHGFEVVVALHCTRGGRSGWNVHLHPEFFFPNAPTDEVLTEVCEVIREQWPRSVRWAFGEERFVPSEHGFHVKRMKNARYVANWALELTATQTKEAKRGGHLTTWQVGYRAARGNVGYGMLWDEFLGAFKGAQSIRWPRSENSRLRQLRDVVRQELAKEAEASEGKAEDVAKIPLPLWRLLKFGRFKGGHSVRGEILDHTEAGGDEDGVWGIVTDYLNARGTRTSGDDADDALWRAREHWRAVERQRAEEKLRRMQWARE